MFKAMRCSSIAYRSSISEAGVAGRSSSDSHSATPMEERSWLRQRRKVVPAPVVCWASCTSSSEKG